MNANVRDASALKALVVVDDAHGSIDGWCDELRAAGVLFSTVGSVPELRQYLAENYADIAVVNGEVNGPAVTEFIEWNARAPQRSKVIFVTADFTARNVVKLAHAADLILPLPLEPALLAEALTVLATRQDDAMRFADLFKLSPREAALFRCALAGLNGEESALALGCSRGTIATFWNRIFRKTQTTSQRNVIVLFTRLVLGRASINPAVMIDSLANFPMLMARDRGSAGN